MDGTVKGRPKDLPEVDFFSLEVGSEGHIRFTALSLTLDVLRSLSGSRLNDQSPGKRGNSHISLCMFPTLRANPPLALTDSTGNEFNGVASLPCRISVRLLRPGWLYPLPFVLNT